LGAWAASLPLTQCTILQLQSSLKLKAVCCTSLSKDVQHLAFSGCVTEQNGDFSWNLINLLIQLSCNFYGKYVKFTAWDNNQQEGCMEYY
jgi:hypothetical protein